MTAQSLNDRLNQSSDAHKTTFQLINRLFKLPIQPGSSSLSSERGDARVELSAEIHQSLKDQQGTFEELRQDVEDFTSGSLTASLGGRRRDSEKDRERARLGTLIARLREDLKQARTQFRKAQLQAKRNADFAKRKERDLLFTGAQENTTSGRHLGQDKLSQDDLLVSATSDVTAALRRTHQLMQSELSRSQFARDTLEESTAALGTLSESYNNLDTLLSSSRSLLASLLRSQKSDTWYLETAFYILVSTIIWLIFRRFFYGPLWWFLWLPLKLSYKIVVGVFTTTIGLSGGATKHGTTAATTGKSLTIQPSATGGFPRHSMSRRAPSVVVGGGGRGAQDLTPSDTARPNDGSISDVVGHMAEDTQRQTSDRQEEDSAQEQKQIEEREPEERPRNPKKRMWVEDTGAKEGDGRKDEL